MLKRIMAFVLATVMLISVTACGNTESKETSGTSAATEAATEEKMPETPNEDYVVVIDEEDASAVSAAERMVWQMKQKYGIDLEVIDHKEKAYVREIVLGKTNRGEKIDTSKMLINDYEIKAVGEKVFIDGASEDGLYGGAVKFLNTCTDENGFKVTGDYSFKDSSGYPIEKLTINGNDISKYTIYYPADASEKTMKGVNELVKYINMACGVTLPTKVGSDGEFAIIVEEKIVVIEGSVNKNVDNFSVKSEGNNIIINGSAERGAMYGCYDLIEDAIGWVFVGDNEDYLAPKDELDIKDLDVTEGAMIFEYRYTSASRFFCTEDMMDKYRMHMKKWWVGGSSHTFDLLDNAPDGTSYSEQHTSQPCLTDEKVYEVIRDNVFKYLEESPDAELISVSQNDNKRCCECENCSKIIEEEGTAAGPIIRFVNRIAEEVEAAGYDVLVHTFAYGYSLNVPQITKPRHNVMIQYCTLEACFSHALTAGCNVKGCGAYEDLPAWGKVTENIYIWDYVTNYSYGTTPCPNLKYDVFATNIQFFADNSAKGIYEQGYANGNSGNFDRLRGYILSKLMWDPYMSEEEYDWHIKRYMEALYGEGWENVYEAMTKWLNKHSICFNCHSSPSLSSAVLKGIAPELISLMDEAKYSAQTKLMWQSTDCSQIQFDYIYLNAIFDSLYKSDDPAEVELSQTMSHALQTKMQQNNVTMGYYSNTIPNFANFTDKPENWRWMEVE